MSERIYRALTRLGKALQDPRVEVYLLLLETLRPLSRRELLQVMKLQPATLDRSLRFLYDNELVDKRQGRQEVYYFPIL